MQLKASRTRLAGHLGNPTPGSSATQRVSSTAIGSRGTDGHPSIDGSSSNARSSADNKSRNAAKSATTLPSAILGFSTGSVSDLRQRQLQEMEKIRLLFEQNNLTFSDQVFERGLLVPEDRPVLDCVRNLPLPGSRLMPNPLVDLRLKKGLAKKKKSGAKKKKKKKGTKTPKSGRAKS